MKKLYEVVNILPTRVQEGDLVLVEVREDIAESRREFLQTVLEDTAEDSKVHFLVLPENLLADFGRLTLQEMLDLRVLLDEAIERTLARLVAGEA